MKYFLVDMVLDTRNLSPFGMQCHLQDKLDTWLGIRKVKIEVEALNEKTMMFTLYRKYGEWYDDPESKGKTFFDSIFSWDEIILEGKGWRQGSYADFDNHPGPYIIYDCVDDFFSDYKQEARRRHCTRIVNLNIKSYLNRVEFTVELFKAPSKSKKTRNENGYE